MSMCWSVRATVLETSTEKAGRESIFLKLISIKLFFSQQLSTILLTDCYSPVKYCLRRSLSPVQNFTMNDECLKSGGMNLWQIVIFAVVRQVSKPSSLGFAPKTYLSSSRLDCQVSQLSYSQRVSAGMRSPSRISESSSQGITAMAWWDVRQLTALLQALQQQHSRSPILMIKSFQSHLKEGKALFYTSFLQGQSLHNVFNRDLTLIVIHTFTKLLLEEKKDFPGLKIADALSASGLRSLRFIKQLQHVEKVWANDISEDSIELIQQNFKLNEIPQDKYTITKLDANQLFLDSRATFPFDVIDLDPFGSAVPFLDTSVQSIGNGGLLCVTCTDTRVTCGPDFQKCYYYYGSTRAKVMGIQQNAVRVVLNSLSSAANRKCRVIQPLFSLQAQFYVRVFVRVFRSRSQCGKIGLRVGNLFNCNACGNYKSKPLFRRKDKDRIIPCSLEPTDSTCQSCGNSLQISSALTRRTHMA